MRIENCATQKMYEIENRNLSKFSLLIKGKSGNQRKVKNFEKKKNCKYHGVPIR